MQALSIDVSFNDPADQGNISGFGAASVFEAAASCGVTSFSMNLYGNTNVGSSISIMGQKFLNFKKLQTLELQFYVINPSDSAAGDAFAADFGAGVAGMRDSLTRLSLDMSCNQVSDAGIAAMGAGCDSMFRHFFHLHQCSNHTIVAVINSSRRTCMSEEHQLRELSSGGLWSARRRRATVHRSWRPVLRLKSRSSQQR